MAVFSMILRSAWRSFKVDHIHVYVDLEGGYKGDRPRLFSVMPSERTRVNGHKLEQKRLSEHKKMLFYCEGDGAPAEVAQRGVVSLLGDIQRPSGHGPGQLAVGDHT